MDVRIIEASVWGSFEGFSFSTYLSLTILCQELRKVMFFRCHHIGTATIKKGGLVTLKKAFENISSHRKSVSINNIIINSYQWLFWRCSSRPWNLPARIPRGETGSWQTELAREFSTCRPRRWLSIRLKFKSSPDDVWKLWQALF